jgi:hypothetical protein
MRFFAPKILTHPGGKRPAERPFPAFRRWASAKLQRPMPTMALEFADDF